MKKLKRTTVLHTSKAKIGQESQQTADKTCNERDKETGSKNDKINKTESENNLKFTGKLTREDTSEGQSSSSNKNNNSRTIPKVYTCDNRTKGKGPKPEENKDNKESTAISSESKCTLTQNSNPEGSSQGRTNNDTDFMSIACNGKSKTKGKRFKIDEKENTKDKTGKLCGSKSKSKIIDKPNSEETLKDLLNKKTEAIPQDVIAKHKRKEKRHKKGGSTRNSSVNKIDNKSDKQDLLEYFKAVESVNEELEQRPEKKPKSDRREDSTNRKESERSTESKSELKAKGETSSDHSTECQRTNISGARPKVFSTSRNGTKGKKPKNDVRRKDKTVIKSENENDENDLIEYFKAVESTNEGIFRSTEHGTNRRGCQVSSFPDQVDETLKSNTHDKNLEMATTDSPDKFVNFIKTIAYQMIGNIERLIEEAKTMLGKKDFRQARQKTLEAMVGAQEAKDQLLLFKNEFIWERNLADWFGTCAYILDKSWDFLAAAKCFYTATVFDPDWTEQKHHAVSSVLWDKILFNYLDPKRLQLQGVVYLLLEMDKLTQLAESRFRWEVCIHICQDALNWEKFLHKEYGILGANPLSKVRRLALSHFKLGEYKAAQTYCMSILNDLTEFNDLVAFEIWARSLFLEKNYDVALKKVELGLNCAKAPSDTERLTALRSEIRSSIPSPQENPEQDLDSLSGKLVTSQSNLEKSYSMPDLQIGELKRPKHCPAISNDFKHTYSRTNDHGYNPDERFGSANNMHESESEESENNEASPTTSELDEDIIENTHDEPSFYEKTCRKFQERSNFDNDEDVTDERLMTLGLTLNKSFMQRFRKSKGTPFYKPFLQEIEIKQRLKQKPNIYKRCILEIDESHLSYCHPIDSNDSRTVIEISGRSKAGQTYNEDEVAVLLLDKAHEKKDRRYGRVVGLINRQRFKDVEHPVFICTLDDMDSHLVRPLCKTVPKINILHGLISKKYPKRARYKIEIYTYDHISQTLSERPTFESINPGERDTYLFLVALLRWSDISVYPQGAVIRMFKCNYTIQQGLKVLDLKYKVPTLYSRNNYECVEGLRARYNGEEGLIRESSERRDLCEIKTFTIDPPDSQDLDDALSVRKIQNGFEVGVHIADVSVFVRKDDPIDNEAYERAVTYYPTIRRPRNMLPEPLSSNLCSLLPNKRRQVISVFFLLGSDGRLLQSSGKNSKVVRSFIKSRQQLTYKEVQDIINDPETSNHPLKNEITMLFKLAKNIRKRRLGDAMFALDVESDEDICADSLIETMEAHYLVEEFMIMANQKVAEILIQKFPSCTPIRCQPPPNREKIESFSRNNSDYVHALVKLQGKKMESGKDICVEKLRGSQSDKYIMISNTLWEAFMREPRKAMRYLMMDDLYPIQHIVYQHWISIQERAEYLCSDGSIEFNHKRHFSLNMYPYTHFTSPIRRYNDLVVHRLLIASLEGNESPYSKTEIEQICIHVNAAMKRAKEYQSACRTLKYAIGLRNNPQMMHCFVDEPTDKAVTLCAPQMKYMDKQSKQLPFNLLDMRHKPELIQDKTTNFNRCRASWRKRIYNTIGVSATPNSRGNLQTLNPNPGFLAVPLHTWARMLTCALENRQRDIKHTMENASLHISQKGVDDVSTESANDMEIEPHTEFSLTFTHGQGLKGQMSCAPHKGCLALKLTLYNMTNNVKLCLQHTDNPVFHLCKYSTKPTSSKYDNAKAYVNTWLPIMLMEAATEAVTNEECFIINNVGIKFNSERSGSFSLNLTFCEMRNIDFSGVEDDEEKSNESGAYDWLCLKFTSIKENQATTGLQGLSIPRLNTVWVGHAEITKVIKKMVKNNDDDRANDGKLIVSFNLHETCPTLPQEARQKRRKFSVEVLRKSEVDRRTEKYLRKLEEAKKESVSMKIALNIGKMPPLDSDHAHLAHIIERDFVVGSEENVHLPENNEKQQEAIDKALTNRFSLIQGPPGTGKSYTGIKLMCLFDKINSIKHKEGGKRHQVLFCGPSNKSVDLVARWMLDKMGNKMPKFLRVYGKTIEAIDFPIPGRTFQSRKSVHNLKADENLRSVSLHHLIRVKGESYAKQITAMDKKFEDSGYAPDPTNVKKYVHLIREASIEMIRKYDVILCTTAVGSNPKVLEASDIFQVIIDEAGMCPEPQCLVPILATEAQQVVLIGDHKQLRPIIKCKEAALLGLSQSLFERYSNNERIPLTMLEQQYRMNPEICRFPSKMFYDDKLTTMPRSLNKEVPYIWPRARNLHGQMVEYPHILVHVEGEEKVLTVSTDEGNEQSKSNQEEVDIVVKVFRYLIEDQSVDAEMINVMSQYNAQVSELKNKLRDEQFQNFKVSTVVSSQGGEWDYVIFSTVRSLPKYKIEERPTKGWCQKNLGFITDQNQINVALTRAKKGIIIVGNKNLLQCDQVWKELISDYQRKGCVKTPAEFPPKKVPRLMRMEINYQRSWERYGDSIFVPGTATSYDGPIDDFDEDDLNRTGHNRGRNRYR